MRTQAHNTPEPTPEPRQRQQNRPELFEEQTASTGSTGLGVYVEPARVRRILVAVDFSPTSYALLRGAAALAREFRARLTMLYVQQQDWIEEDGSNPLVAEAYRDLGKETIARLNQMGEDVVEGNVELVAEFRVGRWARSLVDAGRCEKSDLIVVAGQERRGLLGLLRIHPLDRLVRNAPCPVVVLPERILQKGHQTLPPVRQIAVTAGLSESSRRAVKHAANLALQLNLRLALLHTAPNRGLGTRLDIGPSLKVQKQMFEDIRKTMLGWIAPEIAAGLVAKVLVRTGYPLTRVLERHLSVLNPAMVVLGASQASRFGGKDARAALRTTSAPVVVVGPGCPAEPQPDRVPALAASVPPISSEMAAARREPKRILVVDDDPAVRESLDKLFREEHCDVALAADGHEVIRNVDPAQFDLVLLDLKMRGKNGWATLRHLRAVTPQLPVVLITGLPDRYPLAANAGVSALVEKPFNVPVLLETVHALLSAPLGEDAPPGARPAACRHIRPSSESARGSL